MAVDITIWLLYELNREEHRCTFFPIQRKVMRMESDYHELVVRTEYLKASKQKIKKDIEFYKTVISKVVLD